LVNQAGDTSIKTIVFTAALAVLMTGAALAAPEHAVHRMHHQDRYSNSNASVQRDPDGVYINEQEIGRDPDPITREQLHDQYYQLQGG
jgi:hypothetical protein